MGNTFPLFQPALIDSVADAEDRISQLSTQ